MPASIDNTPFREKFERLPPDEVDGLCLRLGYMRGEQTDLQRLKRRVGVMAYRQRTGRLCTSTKVMQVTAEALCDAMDIPYQDVGL